jgi:hypothetical protein
VKDLHIEICKTLIKAIIDDTNKWYDVPCSWIGRINIFKCLNYTKKYLDIMQSPLKSQ